ALQTYGIHNTVQWRKVGGFHRGRFFAGVVFHRFEWVGQGLQRGEFVGGRRGTGNAAEHPAIVGAVSQSQPFQPAADEVQPRVHGGVVANFRRRPQTLGDGGVSWPDARIDILRADVLDPHGGLAAQNALLFFRREIGGIAAQRVRSVVPRGGPAEVKVIAVGKKPAITLLGRRSEGSLPAPGLNGDVLGQTGVENFIPADHALAMPGDDGLKAFAEIGLQRLVVLDAVSAHVFLNFRIGIPLFAVYFVAADVEELIWKKFRHLSDQ